MNAGMSEQGQQLSSVSLKQSRKLEQCERSSSVEHVLDIESVRFEDLFTGITGSTGFHVLGTELHLLLELQGSSNPKKV
jgi:hypothetical protein